MDKRKNKQKNTTMDYVANSKTDKEAIYEIYRSCRLCGAGAGYKMPIIQNVVNLDENNVELKDKIKDCVQIEVDQNDRMPPLICELCVDKVQDFYEFLEMCRNTNKKTRLKLGLPEQTVSKETDNDDCILGISEPVFVKKETTAKSNVKKSTLANKVKGKVVIKKENKAEKAKGSRELQQLLQEKAFLQRLTSKPNHTLGGKNSNTIQREQRRNTLATPAPKSILKKREENSSASQLKRTRDKEHMKQETQTKRVKIQETPPKPVQTSTGDDSCIKKCAVCKRAFDNNRALSNHMRSHKLSEIKSASEPTRKLQKTKIDETKFETPRQQGGECKFKNCKKYFSNGKSLKAHEATCAIKRKLKVKINIPAGASRSAVKNKTLSRKQLELRKRLKPIQIRMMRCDALLGHTQNGHYDVSMVQCPYGLDKNCAYPYKPNQRSHLSENKMVDIKDMTDFDFEADFKHWDSESSDSDSDIYIEKRKKVDSLSTLTLKTIFSNKCLGKIPRKKRKIKTYDSMMGSDADSDFRLDIDSIIHNLGDNNTDKNKKVKNVLNNVICQNDSDYDSDRTSFNEDVEQIKYKSHRQNDGNDNNSTDSNLESEKIDFESKFNNTFDEESRTIDKDKENCSDRSEIVDKFKAIRNFYDSDEEDVAKNNVLPNFDAMFDELKSQNDITKDCEDKTDKNDSINTEEGENSNTNCSLTENDEIINTNILSDVQEIENVQNKVNTLEEMSSLDEQTNKFNENDKADIDEVNFKENFDIDFLGNEDRNVINKNKDIVETDSYTNGGTKRLEVSDNIPNNINGELNKVENNFNTENGNCEENGVSTKTFEIIDFISTFDSKCESA